MPDSSTGPGPVLTKDAIEKGIVSVLSSVALLTARYGWWSPSGEDVLTIAGVAGSVYAFLGLVASFFTREQVRPEADVQKAIEQGVAERLAAVDAERLGRGRGHADTPRRSGGRPAGVHGLIRGG
jgi:hypothetical protein